ncbi:MAG: SIS domain-containing protein [Sphaerochaetaceae bacterium]
MTILTLYVKVLPLLFKITEGIRMTFQQTYNTIISEIKNSGDRIDFQNMQQIIHILASANQVFCIGAGRSGIILNAFCMRLNQMGIKAYIVGSTNCPPAQQDILIAISGSGETKGVLTIVEEAKNLACTIISISSAHNSTLTTLSDYSLIVDAPYKLINGNESMQPMRSLFEQTAFLICETISFMIKSSLKLDETFMAMRHANLE